MTTRKLRLVRIILDVLENLDGGQLSEVVLNAEANLHITPTATLAEFEDALSHCDQCGWVIGITSRVNGGRKWSLSDAGTAARLEIK